MVSPEYSLGVLAGNPHTHSRDTKTCVWTMLNCINPESNSDSKYVREDIVSVINRNHVVVICGETGSGKTTQAAQFIFEDYIRGGQGSRCSIVVTQRKRIAAISMAKRAALKRHEELSDTVGFHVRLTKQLLTSRGGKLFCTAGMQLRHWQQNVELQGLSHVIVDEAHEHDVCTNFLLVLLREVLSIHRTFKVILMSATINTEKFSECFDDAPCGSDAVRIVPDVFMHIVEMKPSKAIFCFLPGWNEINKVRTELCERAPARFDDWILPLHSRLRYQEQQNIFENPPADVRKVILSTNLAETSVTVDDVVYVVGTGLHRDQRFNPSTGVSLLGTLPASMASVQQREGRAGRLRSGESCHLITENEFLSWDQFKRPEIQTTDLTTVVLDFKTIVANAPHLPDDEIEEEASGSDVVPDNAGAKRTVYDIMTGRQLTVSSKSNLRIDRELMAKVEKSWKYYQRARLQLPIFARRGSPRPEAQALRRCRHGTAHNGSRLQPSPCSAALVPAIYSAAPCPSYCGTTVPGSAGGLIVTSAVCFYVEELTVLALSTTSPGTFKGLLSLGRCFR
ncbi:ATP-dependent RNA helicase DHX30-like [Dermacentor silvarum]|uniref:ATP-dependent RNA helicase DHX30-like n=1 Tax=Dermacentor silvarum TaxID=543639 RepID=UPI0021016DD6|nr:ATP-dependent RNA helicase DHX30-like [Dermacentor silvarum]